jgi:hypothetical protein
VRTLIFLKMGLFKTALIGAAIYGIVKYVTKKDINGRSIADDIKEKAPEWMEKAKNLKDDLKVELEKQRY